MTAFTSLEDVQLTYVGEHFVGIVLWHGRSYLYDGLKPTKNLRFTKYHPEMIIKSFNNCKGSYAYYFISD